MPAPAETRRTGLRRTQLSDEVAGRLRAEIMSGTLRPGTFIRLDETAAQLGVSITPVREALLTLRGEGMVQLEPHRGYVVLPMSRQDIADIFWLQSTIAKELAISATSRITDEDIDQLERLNDNLAEAVATGDSESVVLAEFAFHRTFNRAAGRIKLAWYLLHVARSMPALLYGADPEWGADAVTNHRDLIAALRARDADAAAAHTAWQFTDGASRLTEVLERSGIWDT
ncbi:GntR family transcriptional regulator [Mycobacterium sp. MS1601]|uniref:GntR family transcriptional regulator n=1 Tax=Mycobacterium sp. MS1601 TaxID=1936029 RepID=UPI000979535F|nr:GntR family transcriptional regulator [Mycobacterium sp. MS1601]AQA03500.1 GntR family transcriptional regulator [Mycobacterium sp. MS1601]